LIVVAHVKVKTKDFPRLIKEIEVEVEKDVDKVLKEGREQQVGSCSMQA